MRTQNKNERKSLIPHFNFQNNRLPLDEYDLPAYNNTAVQKAYSLITAYAESKTLDTNKLLRQLKKLTFPPRIGHLLLLKTLVKGLKRNFTLRQRRNYLTLISALIQSHGARSNVLVALTCRRTGAYQLTVSAFGLAALYALTEYLDILEDRINHVTYINQTHIQINGLQFNPSIAVLTAIYRYNTNTARKLLTWLCRGNPQGINLDNFCRNGRFKSALAYAIHHNETLYTRLLWNTRKPRREIALIQLLRQGSPQENILDFISDYGVRQINAKVATEAQSRYGKNFLSRMKIQLDKYHDNLSTDFDVKKIIGPRRSSLTEVLTIGLLNERDTDPEPTSEESSESDVSKRASMSRRFSFPGDGNEYRHRTNSNSSVHRSRSNSYPTGNHSEKDEWDWRQESDSTRPSGSSMSESGKTRNKAAPPLAGMNRQMPTARPEKNIEMKLATLTQPPPATTPLITNSIMTTAPHHTNSDSKHDALEAGVQLDEEDEPTSSCCC